MPRLSSSLLCVVFVTVAAAVAAGGGVSSAEPPCGTASDPICIQSCAQRIIEAWQGGYSTEVTVTFPQTVEQFTVTLRFDRPLVSLESWAALLHTADNQSWALSNSQWDGHHNKDTSEVFFLKVTDSDPLQASTLESAEILGVELCQF